MSNRRRDTPPPFEHPIETARGIALALLIVAPFWLVLLRALWSR